MNIKIRLRDKKTKQDKTYICDFVSLETYEQALKVKDLIREMVENNHTSITENLLEEGIKLLIKVYDNQFTFQDAVEGLNPFSAFGIFLEHSQICLGELEKQSLS